MPHLAPPCPGDGYIPFPLVRIANLFPPSQPLPDLDHPEQQKGVHLQRTLVHQKGLFLRARVVLRVRVIDVPDGLLGFGGKGGTERVEEFGEDRTGDLVGVSIKRKAEEDAEDV